MRRSWAKSCKEHFKLIEISDDDFIGEGTKEWGILFPGRENNEEEEEENDEEEEEFQKQYDKQCQLFMKHIESLVETPPPRLNLKLRNCQFKIDDLNASSSVYDDGNHQEWHHTYRITTIPLSTPR